MKVQEILNVDATGATVKLPNGNTSFFDWDSLREVYAAALAVKMVRECGHSSEESIREGRRSASALDPNEPLSGVE